MWTRNDPVEETDPAFECRGLRPASPPDTDRNDEGLECSRSLFDARLPSLQRRLWPSEGM